MALQLYNSLSRKKEEFVPVNPGRVGIYVCGPTVYGAPHIGHAKSYVSFDVIVRYLRFRGYRVLYVQNITDVGHLTDDADMGEDKIEKRSRADQIHPMQIAEIYTRKYFADMDALGVGRPDIAPRATGHIIEQIALASELLEKGFAYETNGSVYFDVRKFQAYGSLSRRSLDEVVEGTRVESRTEKRFPADFALWKKAEAGHIMKWPSPWGEGFPGWHLECSAMSMKYLGETFDIHGGGLDNQFPHHECEIAQSVCATGKPFVRYWLHNNLVTVNGQKMGKSLGNSVYLDDAFAKFSPTVIRFFILQSHYRSTLDYSEEAVEASRRGLEKLTGTYERLQKEAAKPERGTGELDVASYHAAFVDAMDDDFNAPQGIAVLFDLARGVNDALARPDGLSSKGVSEALALLRECGGAVLGIVGTSATPTEDVPTSADELMKVILAIREEARATKLWKISDRIRDELKSVGIVLEDTRDGTMWRKQ